MTTPEAGVRSGAGSPGSTIRHWWERHIRPRELGGARALAARLNRADAVEALSEPAVHELLRDLGWNDHASWQVRALLRLARVLPMVREHTDATLARRLGAGEVPPMSALRFQRLLRADDEELVTALRRALPMVERRCNVAALGRDLVEWGAPGDRVRTRWCFDYFGAAAPTAAAETPSPEEETP